MEWGINPAKLHIVNEVRWVDGAYQFCRIKATKLQVGPVKVEEGKDGESGCLDSQGRAQDHRQLRIFTR